jgi:hypothetical protein
MTQRFEKAYNALYNAFMNDTLAKGTCKACAVGNIVADAMGAKVYKREWESSITFHCSKQIDWWQKMFVTGYGGQRITKISEDSKVKQLRKKILNLTGYTWRELARIEKTFEESTKIGNSYYLKYTPEQIMEDQFNGLMAVMDVMIELDNIKQGSTYKETFKNKFINLV